MPQGRRELFNLVDDSAEQRNLAAKSPDRVDALMAHWEQFDAAAPRWQAGEVGLEIDAEDLETLRALGYVGGK